jgi:hypothetical protein
MMTTDYMARTVSMMEINTTSSDTSDYSPIADETPCYAIFQFPDSLYRLQSLKLLLGREPDDVITYNQRLIVTEEAPNNPRKRKRNRSGSVATLLDEDSLSDPLLPEAAALHHVNYENCVTSIGGIGGPQPEPMFSDDPDETFLAIHPQVNEHGEVQDQAISKKHIRILFDYGLGWKAEVLGRNGMFLNQTWHGKGEQLLLQDKDVFTVAGLHFIWHITNPYETDDEDSDDDLLSDYAEASGAMFEDVKGLVVELPSRSTQAMNLDEDDEDDEEDDGYQEEDEEDKPRPKVVPRQKKQSKAERRREQKARSKAKKKQRALDEKKQRELARQAALDDDGSDDSDIDELAEAKPSLKLKLKIPKQAGKSIKALASKKMPAKVPKLVKDETMEVIDNFQSAGKKLVDLAGKAPEAMDVPQATTESGEGMTDVVQSVEKSERQPFTPTGGPGDSAPPNGSATPQVSNRRDLVLAGLEPPPKRRGPGRPPADGVMSKRERRERQKAEAAGIPYGDPLPYKERSREGDLGGSGEKPKKKVKREVTGDEEGGGEDGDDKGEPTPPRPREPSPKESDYPPERLQKPDETYQVLLYHVLQEAKEPLALPGVYDAIKNKWPYYRFKVGGTGWESSVRHNLQSSRYFMKAGKAGKGHLWALDPNEPFEHKTKRASPPPGSAPYQQPRPGYAYQNGQPGMPRPATYNQYYPPQNGQRPPGQQPYYNPNVPGQNRPPPGPPRPANGWPPGTVTRPNPALAEVLSGKEPEVFGKFIEQLRKITQTPGAPDGPNTAVEHAKGAIIWIMKNKLSDVGLEKESTQLQHMVKVLKTLLEPTPVNPPPRPAGPPMSNSSANAPPPPNGAVVNGPLPTQPRTMQSGMPGQTLPPNGIAGHQMPRPVTGPPPLQGTMSPGVAPGLQQLHPPINPGSFPGQVLQPGVAQPGVQQVPTQPTRMPIPGQAGFATPPQLFQPGSQAVAGQNTIQPGQAIPMVNGLASTGSKPLSASNTPIPLQGPQMAPPTGAGSRPTSTGSVSSHIVAPATVSLQQEGTSNATLHPALASGLVGSGASTTAGSASGLVPSSIPISVAAPTLGDNSVPTAAIIPTSTAFSANVQNATPNATISSPTMQGAKSTPVTSTPSLSAEQRNPLPAVPNTGHTVSAVETPNLQH